MRRLDERELEGVLAHELSHVAHRDVTVMTIASVVGVLAASRPASCSSAAWAAAGATTTCWAILVVLPPGWSAR